MRAITIQSKLVIEQLNKNGKYTVPNNVPVSKNLVKPYHFMMKHYKYSNRPIFLCPVGYHVNFGGAKLNDAYIIELDIPDRFCKIQDYYSWSDFIYFTEIPWEFKEFRGCKTVEQFGTYVLDMYNNGFDRDNNIVYQVTTQFLRKSWVKKIIPMNNDFEGRYVDTGGENILASIMKWRQKKCLD